MYVDQVATKLAFVFTRKLADVPPAPVGAGKLATPPPVLKFWAPHLYQPAT